MMMDMLQNIIPAIPALLDPGFVPACLWNRNYQAQVEKSNEAIELAIALLRPDGTVSRFDTKILPLADESEGVTLKYIERILKFLLWQRGGYQVKIAGCNSLGEKIAAIYSPEGDRHFDFEFFGEKAYLQTLEIVTCPMDEMPEANEQSIPLGRHIDGCRIGFDLGGSDRKCAAVIDGEVVFTEEIEWNPYFENDPEYHIDGINDSLKHAAAHLPRVDAIGGSSAGVYVNNEVRVASLFRGLSQEDFDSKIRRVFFDLKEQWGNVPFVVVNDGEVTALAGSMSMKENSVLGLAMGTSQAVGYVAANGNIAPWLNELAFAPVDYRDDAPADEWSGDVGCGVQYFSQQGVARLAKLAGLDYGDMPFAEQLMEVQKLMAEGDERARKIYKTIGTYLGYSIAHYADFYEIRKMLLLGRVTSGVGGTIIIENAVKVLETEFPRLAKNVEIVTPNEKDKRHGQAVAAASLPPLNQMSC